MLVSSRTSEAKPADLLEAIERSGVELLVAHTSLAWNNEAGVGAKTPFEQALVGL